MILKTNRLIIREYTLDDFDALYEILSDAETMKYYPKPYDEAGVRRWINRWMDSYRQYGFGLWALELKDTGTFIGDCGVSMQNIDGEMLPEIGYHVHKNYWRQGYAKEACAAVKDWFFENTDYDAVYSYMNRENIASFATAASNGMTRIKAYEKGDEALFVYRITRGEWEKSRGENMNTITYLLLTEHNFNEDSLDDFLRHQEIKECFRKNSNNEYVLVANEYVEDWDLKKRKDVAREILHKIAGKGFAYGAFCEEKVVGYILVSNELFGSSNQYVELLLFHVSEPYRRRGIGKELFKLACKTAREIGVKKLYISAHSSKESQAAYRKLGCTEATEINQVIAENEPYDVQMEFVL